MSRIGMKPVEIPDNVTLQLDGQRVIVSGPKGQLELNVNPAMQLSHNNGTLVVSRPSDQRRHRQLHGLTRTLIANMVIGVTDGYSKELEIQGVGYRATLDGADLVLNIGFSHPVRVVSIHGIDLTVEGNNRIMVSGIDKQLVGEVAARIRNIRPPEPYKGKGIRYRNEIVRRKAGKAGKVGV